MFIQNKLCDIQQKHIDIPTLIIALSFLWLLLTNIPFFAPIRNYIIVINSILFLCFLFTFRNYNIFKDFNKPFFLMLVWCLISAIVTKTFFNKSTWFTISLSITAYAMANQFNEKRIKFLWNSVFISINIVTILSFIGYLLIVFTDLENSSIYRVSYSLGNFMQSNRFFGILNNPNLLGPLSAISCFMASYNIYKNKTTKNITLFCTLIIINLIVLYLTGCRSALLASIATTLCILLFSIKKYRLRNFIIILFFCLVLITLLISFLPVLTSLTGRDWVTGSGRTKLAKNAVELIKNSPLIGYGSIKNYLDYCLTNNITMNDAGTHNNYLEIATTYGIPALIFYIISIILLVVKILKSYFNYTSFYESELIINLALLVFLLTYGMFESIMTFTPIQVLFLISFFSLDTALKKENKKNKNKSPIFHK